MCDRREGEVAAGGARYKLPDWDEKIAVSRTHVTAMSNYPPKPLKILGFQSKVIGNDPPKPLKILGFRSKVIGRKDSKVDSYSSS